MHNYEIINIDCSSTQLLSTFLNQLGDGESQFRYYQKRSFSILENHLVTLLLIYDDKPIAYGHLDKEDENIWLGIAVAESYYGSGFGKIMMAALMSKAHDFNCHEINLTVDLDNLPAISLYKKFGFSIKKKTDKYIHLRHMLN